MEKSTSHRCPFAIFESLKAFNDGKKYRERHRVLIDIASASEPAKEREVEGVRVAKCKTLNTQTFILNR